MADLRAAAAHDGHDVELQALRGVGRHEAHGVEALAGQRRRPLLDGLEPARELVGGENGIERVGLGELADVANGGKHVGGHGTAGDALALEAREPAGLADGHEQDVCHGQLAHTVPGPRDHATGVEQALGGSGRSKVRRVLADANVDAALRRGVEHVLRTGGEHEHVVAVELEHPALEHAEQAALGVLRARQAA